MSLNAEQRDGTRRELQQNLVLSGLTRDAVAARLGWSATRFESAMMIATGADPADVWILRDALEMAVRDAGLAPTRYSVLTEDMRGSAQRWFGLKVPERFKPTDKQPAGKQPAD